MITGRPSSPRDRPRPFLVVGAWCAGGALLIGVAVLCGWLVRTGWAADVDRDWLSRVADLRSEDVTAVLRWVTVLGDPRLLLAGTAIAAAALARSRQFPSALLLATSGGGALVLTVAAKWLVARDRPAHIGLATTQSSTLPSGHSALVVACLGAAAVTLGGAWRSSRRRAARWTVVSVLAIAVGFSRVYLGVHWPSDVVLGWLIGAGWLATCTVATRALVPAHRVNAASTESWPERRP